MEEKSSWSTIKSSISQHDEELLIKIFEDEMKYADLHAKASPCIAAKNLIFDSPDLCESVLKSFGFISSGKDKSTTWSLKPSSTDPTERDINLFDRETNEINISQKVRDSAINAINKIYWARMDTQALQQKLSSKRQQELDPIIKFCKSESNSILLNQILYFESADESTKSDRCPMQKDYFYQIERNKLLKKPLSVIDHIYTDICERCMRYKESHALFEARVLRFCKQDMNSFIEKKSTLDTSWLHNNDDWTCFVCQTINNSNDFMCKACHQGINPIAYALHNESTTFNVKDPFGLRLVFDFNQNEKKPDAEKAKKLVDDILSHESSSNGDFWSIFIGFGSDKQGGQLVIQCIFPKQNQTKTTVGHLKRIIAEIDNYHWYLVSRQKQMINVVFDKGPLFGHDEDELLWPILQTKYQQLFFIKSNDCFSCYPKLKKSYRHQLPLQKPLCPNVSLNTNTNSVQNTKKSELECDFMTEYFDICNKIQNNPNIANDTGCRQRLLNILQHVSSREHFSGSDHGGYCRLKCTNYSNCTCVYRRQHQPDYSDIDGSNRNNGTQHPTATILECIHCLLFSHEARKRNGNFIDNNDHEQKDSIAIEKSAVSKPFFEYISSLEDVLSIHQQFKIPKKLQVEPMTALNQILLLMSEVIENGFERDLEPKQSNFDCKWHISKLIKDYRQSKLSKGQVQNELESQYKIIEILKTKMEDKSHKTIGKPLSYSFLLALILYCNGDCNYDLCLCQRDIDGTYSSKWPIFDYLLNSAIQKLSPYTKFDVNLYSGLCGVQFEVDASKRRTILGFRTNVSFSTDPQVAKEFRGHEGMIMVLNPSKSIFAVRDYITICDVSWISHYPYEKEMLASRNSCVYVNTNSICFKDSNQLLICDDETRLIDSLILSLLSV